MSEEERELSANSSIGASRPRRCNEHPQTQQRQECPPGCCTPCVPPTPPLLCSPALPIPHPLPCFPQLQEQLSCHLGELGVPKRAGALCGRAGIWCARSPSHHHSFWEIFLPFSLPPVPCRLGGKHSFPWAWRLGSVRNGRPFHSETHRGSEGMQAPRSSSASDEGI